MVAGRVEADEFFELLGTLNTSALEWRNFIAKNQGQRTVSLKQPAPTVPLTPENAPFHESKSTLLEAANQLIRLVRGPREALLALSFEHCATTSLQVALKYKFAAHIPLHGTTTYAKIAQDVGQGVSTALVERIVQHCASFGLFDAIPGGYVGHNDVSALLVTDPDIEAWMYLNATIAFPAGANVPKAIEQYGYSMEANESAYGISIGRKISQFSHFREPDNLKNHEMFARAMRGIAKGGAYDIGHVIDGGYPWHLLQEGNGHLVVDVGGGPGHVIMGLAKKYPELRFEVQDLPETVEVGAQACEESLRPRIAFRAHDFMTPQPKHKVDQEGIVYFCRFILHDWSDKYAREIVQQLAYGLRENDRIILNDVVVPEPGQELREIERRMQYVPSPDVS